LNENLKIFIKNSSKDINFGDYALEVKMMMDGGRVLHDKEYIAKVYCIEKEQKIIVVVADDRSGLETFENNVLRSRNV